MRLASPIPHKRARIEIIPLIDIMFFLLASFMMVSLSQTHMKGIKVALPSTQAPPPTQVKDYVSIRVGAGNAVSSMGSYVQDEEIMSRLYRLHEANPGIKVSISAAGVARQQMSSPFWTKSGALEFRKSATRSVRPRVGPLLLPALRGLPPRRLHLRINLQYRGGLPAARRSLVRGD